MNNKRMSPGRFFDNFWKIVISIYLTVFCAVSVLTFIQALIVQDTLNLRRFQYDFFATLSGKEEAMEYDRQDAVQIAQVLRAIPAERRNEDFSIMLTLALAGKSY